VGARVERLERVQGIELTGSRVTQKRRCTGATDPPGTDATTADVVSPTAPVRVLSSLPITLNSSLSRSRSCTLCPSRAPSLSHPLSLSFAPSLPLSLSLASALCTGASATDATFADVVSPTAPPEPCTLNPKPYTLHPDPQTLNLQPGTLNPKTRDAYRYPSVFFFLFYSRAEPINSRPCTLSSFSAPALTPYTIHYTPSTLHPTPYTLHPQLFTLCGD